MLRFFRNTRIKFFASKRLSQYLIYAVGEVLLVIIGILIAVNLNNANERRKERAEINSLLRQVQVELNTNIERIDGLYLYYARKDSLIYNFLNEVVPSKEINPAYLGQYISLALNYSSNEIESDAYEALMKKAEYFPSEYTALIQSLKTIYRQGKKNMESTFTSINKSITEEVEYLSSTQPWYTDLFYRSTVAPEVDSFILNDVIFINKVTDYSNLANGNLMPIALNLKQQAIEAFRQIDELLPESGKTSEATFEYNIADYQSWLGKYRDPSDLDTMQIVEAEGKMRFLWQGSDFEIFPLNNRDFTVNYPFYLKMFYDSGGSVKELRGHYPNRRFVYKKLD